MYINPFLYKRVYFRLLSCGAGAIHELIFISFMGKLILSLNFIYSVKAATIWKSSLKFFERQIKLEKMNFRNQSKILCSLFLLTNPCKIDMFACWKVEICVKLLKSAFQINVWFISYSKCCNWRRISKLSSNFQSHI